MNRQCVILFFFKKIRHLKFSVLSLFQSLGAGSLIYDTHFHSLAAVDCFVNNKPSVPGAFIIEKKVYTDANCTIVKAVSIEDNSITRACSIVTKSIPPNDTWSENPTKSMVLH